MQKTTKQNTKSLLQKRASSFPQRLLSILANLEEKVDKVLIQVAPRNKRGYKETAQDITSQDSVRNKLKDLFRVNHTPNKERRSEIAQEIAGPQADPPLVVALVYQINQFYRDQRSYFQTRILHFAKQYECGGLPVDATRLKAIVSRYLASSGLPTEYEKERAARILKVPYGEYIPDEEEIRTTDRMEGNDDFEDDGIDLAALRVYADEDSLQNEPKQKSTRRHIIVEEDEDLSDRDDCEDAQEMNDDEEERELEVDLEEESEDEQEVEEDELPKKKATKKKQKSAVAAKSQRRSSRSKK